MRPRQQHRWLIWLLPLIVLRAFVPAGFMVMMGEAGPELMLCSGSGPIRSNVPLASAQQHHEHHAQMQAAVAGGADAGHPSHDQGQNVHEGSLCPFAAVGWTAISGSDYAWTAPWLAADDANPIRDTSTLRSLSPLIDRIRGPPLA